MHQEDIVEFITDEEEDAVMEQMFKPIPSHHEPLIPTQEELDSEHVGPPEMNLGDVDAKKERLEEIRIEIKQSKNCN